jgi:hypothetical protein
MDQLVLEMNVQRWTLSWRRDRFQRCGRTARLVGRRLERQNSADWILNR